MAANASQATIPVTVCDDAAAEGPESFTLRLAKYGQAYQLSSATESTFVIKASDQAETGVPGLPESLRLIIGSTPGAFTVRWEKPAKTGASAITRYEVQQRAAGGSWPTTDVDVSATPSGVGSHRFTGLDAATSHQVRVRAVSSTGAGPWTQVVSVTPGPPPAPAGLLLLAGDRNLIAAWNGPANPAEKQQHGITGWEVQHKPSSRTAWPSSSRSAGATPDFDITGLSNGTSYDVRVRAVNPAGKSAWSAAASGTPEAAPPADPTSLPRVGGVRATGGFDRGAGTLTVSWSSPSASLRVDGYEIEYKEADAAEWSRHDWVPYSYVFGKRIPPTPTPTPREHRRTGAVIKDLTPDTAYQVRMRAVNPVGAGPWSSVVNASTLPKPEPTFTAPPPPTRPSTTSRPAATPNLTVWDTELTVRQLDGGILWSSTLTVEDTGNGNFGCSTTKPCAAALSNDDFVFDGVEYQVETINLATNGFDIWLDTTIPDRLKTYTLRVGSRSFALPSAAIGASLASWTDNQGMTWTAGDTIRLSIVNPPITPTKWGCDNGNSSLFPELGKCSTGLLTDDRFSAEGDTYQVRAVQLQSATAGGRLTIVFDKSASAALRKATLRVGSKTLKMSEASYSGTGSRAYWDNTGLDWDLAEQVPISLRLAPPPRTPALANDWQSWQTLLTVHDQAPGDQVAQRGCDQSECPSALTDPTFVYDGVTYTMESVLLVGGVLIISWDKNLPSSLVGFSLQVGDEKLEFLAVNANNATFNLVHQQWPVGSKVWLSLHAPPDIRDWSVSMPVKSLSGSRLGCESSVSDKGCLFVLDDPFFSLDGKHYQVTDVYTSDSGKKIHFNLNARVPALRDYLLRVDGQQLAFSYPNTTNVWGPWEPINNVKTTPFNWSAGSRVKLSFERKAMTDAQQQQQPVSGAATPLSITAALVVKVSESVSCNDTVWPGPDAGVSILTIGWSGQDCLGVATAAGRAAA